MANKIEDLREHLFDTLKALRDPDKPMDIARAKAVADVAQTIINTAKVEVDYMQTTGQRTGSGFMPQPELPAESTDDKVRALNRKVAART